MIMAASIDQHDNPDDGRPMNVKHLFITVLLLCLSCSAFAIPVKTRVIDGEGPWVVRVYDVDSHVAGHLRQNFDVWAIDSDDSYAVIGIEGRRQLDELRAMAVKFHIDPIASERYRTPLMVGFGGDSIPNFPCYRTVEATFNTAQTMVATHPRLARLIDVGDSWEKVQDSQSGFDLWVLRLTNQAVAGPKPALFVMSAIHARELTTAELMTRFAERLVNGYNENADITWLLDHHEIHLLLQSNPDGRKQAEAGQSWRKNTNENYCGATSTSRGADLNRNFPWEWGGAASTNECGATYQGPSPASEPEVQAVVDYVRDLFPDQRGDALSDPAPLDATGVFIDVHSFSQLVLWPYGFSNNAGQAPNQDQLSTMGRRLAFFNSYRPQQILGLTAASGSTADFSYGELGVASFAFELGTEFFQECNVFENAILEQNINAMMYAARVARTPYQTPSGPDVSDIRVAPNILLPGESATLMLQADGTRFSTLPDSTSPIEPPRLIDGVEIFVDTLPWQGTATVNAAPDDGAFDSAQETASVSIASAGLSVGRHTIFAQAIASNGQEGPISADFLFVLDPATAGAISGRVLVDGTNVPVADALIQVDAFHTSSNAQGDYRLNLPPGSYTVHVSAEGFGSNTASVVINPNEDEALNLSLFSRCNVFADHVESDNVGWTTTGTWAITTEQANSPTHSWHDSPGGNYPDNQNMRLTSPVIDLSLASETSLDFNHICDTEAGFDFGIVEISDDGSNWQEVYRCDDQESWQSQSVDLSALDGRAAARLRFVLSTDVTVTDNGWFVDDVQVSASGGMCQPLDADILLADSFE